MKINSFCYPEVKYNKMNSDMNSIPGGSRKKNMKTIELTRYCRVIGFALDNNNIQFNSVYSGKY